MRKLIAKLIFKINSNYFRGKNYGRLAKWGISDIVLFRGKPRLLFDDEVVDITVKFDGTFEEFMNVKENKNER